MQQNKSIEELTLIAGYYYRDKATGRVFLFREVGHKNLVGVQCFCKSAKDCEILKPLQLKELNIELYATDFRNAFNRYWRENRQRLMMENKAEMAGFELPDNYFDK